VTLQNQKYKIPNVGLPTTTTTTPDTIPTEYEIRKRILEIYGNRLAKLKVHSSEVRSVNAPII
jgi:hypothetical protein